MRPPQGVCALLVVACVALGACDAKDDLKPVPQASPSPPGLKFTASSFTAEASTKSGSSGIVVDGLTGIQMVDANTGYAVGGPRMILKTTDGGQTWARAAGQAEATNWTRLEAFTDLAFLNAQHGFVLAPSGCFRTMDGGASWVRVPEFKAGFVYSAMQFYGPTEGVAIGPQVPLLHTSDGGATWQEEPNDAAGQPLMISRVADLGSIGGSPAFLGTAFMIRQAEGWRALKQPQGGGFAFHFRDAQNGWMVGATLYKTFDGASSWVDTVTDPAWAPGMRVRVLGDAEAWIATGASVAWTNTGGVQWLRGKLVDPFDPGNRSVYQDAITFAHSGLQVVGPNDVWFANGTKALYHYTGN
ncbi:MAG: uncharacterized protein JWM80_6570 [Cyanobacteria bacterium RYN_339]|nr:uncharacterized protein [Cyanobacteria bacterium RYN_339]